MTTKYHTRDNYEKLYLRLVKERNMVPIKNLIMISDYKLMQAINKQLIDLNCIPLEGEEFEIELH